MYLEIAKQAALAGGDVLKQGFGIEHELEGNIAEEDGSRSSLSTIYDKKSDLRVKEVIKSNFPIHAPYGIISEESGNIIVEDNRELLASPDELRKLEYVWVIDPLCGSILYDRGIRDFVLSISLLRNGEIMLGVVYDPGHDELFYAEKGKGAFLLEIRENPEEPKKIEVAQVTSIERKSDKERRGALISIEHKMIREDRFTRFVTEISKRMTRLRVAGSCGLELCYVACGRTDSMIRTRQPIYDYAAGKIIVEQAGGEVTNFRGEILSVDLDKEQGADILASNGNIHQEILDFLRRLIH